MGKHNDSESSLLYFFLGGVIGTTVAMLFAPKSGRKTRDFIGEKAVEGKRAVERGMENVRKQVYKYRKKASDESEDLTEKGKHFVEREKEAIAAAVEAGIETYKKMQKSLD